ncbi:hypothetical protein TR631_33805 [Streptomyces rochei]|uniref:hypothetical protein n=1 Tax=Streptomyces rochei TaxID=1928 RepID=UPI002ACD4533|nr:hypothetical protein [Streptomyces rochei]WQC16539.1 hypothetical protein TR631_33805 [Streptomyces rochei]
MSEQDLDARIDMLRGFIRQAHETGLDRTNPTQVRVLVGMLETLQRARDASPPPDPRWEWVKTPSSDGTTEWVKGACRHLSPVDVRSVITNELLAHLCPDCDTQLPA